MTEEQDYGDEKESEDNQLVKMPTMHLYNQLTEDKIKEIFICSKRILVVDDELFNLQSLIIMLKLSLKLNLL